MTRSPGRDPEAPAEGVRVNDRRKIDPDTGAVRPGARVSEPPEPTPAPAPAAAPAVGAAPDHGRAELEAEVAALKNDLQRVAAEYANYRKRVERDREAVTDLAMGAVWSELLSALDDVGRARAHDELTDALKAVADTIDGAAAKLGLERFGEPGDPFDPVIHEALAHSAGEDLPGPTCVEIYQPGYRFRGRVIRPARVIVQE